MSRRKSEYNFHLARVFYARANRFFAFFFLNRVEDELQWVSIKKFVTKVNNSEELFLELPPGTLLYFIEPQQDGSVLNTSAKVATIVVLL